MRVLALVAPLALFPANIAAEDAQLRYETRVIQLPQGARPHDAAPGRDGEIWYTAQRQGALGIIDIASWTFHGSPPYRVVVPLPQYARFSDGVTRFICPNLALTA